MLSRRRALALTAAAPFALAAPRSVAAAEAVTLKAGTSPTDAYAEPLYFAPSGISAKTGITLDVSLFSSSTAHRAPSTSALPIRSPSPTASCTAFHFAFSLRVRSTWA
jgi:hypothetical protein